jgi:NAD(P)-dependent dehydrogenase (short-subunit alcohol dehydrogenase family)
MVITGGSRGIGAATVLLAARRGYDVCFSYLAAVQRAEAVVREAESAGARAIAVQGDVSDGADVSRLFATVDEHWGSIDAVVNNAGVLFPQCRTDELDAERIRRVFDVNVVGAFLVVGEAVRRMSTRHGGHGGSIVNVSSRAAVNGSPFEYVDYAASKGAIESLTVGLAKEVAPEGIRVNAVRPGLIRTDIHAAGGEPGRPDRLAPGIPMRRPGEPEEVAEAILWLASDEARFVTGTFIDVAGGF